MRGCIAGITNLMLGEMRAIANLEGVQLRDRTGVVAIWAHGGSFRS